MLEASESLTATESSQGSFFPVGSSRKELRPHQVRALDMLRASLRQGNRRVIIQAPTGAGKTVLAAKILEGALAKGNRAIFTAPMINLIDQTVAAFEAEGVTWIPENGGPATVRPPRRKPPAPAASR